MAKKELICINCPMGCRLDVDIAESGEMTVTGNNCPRGETYAKKELTNPTRIVTSIAKVKNGEVSVVSVKTAADIPKEKIMAVIHQLKNIELEAPVHIGDVVISNVADTGVDVIATRNVEVL